MKKFVVFTLMIVALLGLVSCGGSETETAANPTSSGATGIGITITDAWVRSSPMMERAGAAYMVIENSGAADDKLLSVTSDVSATIELHETKDVGGKMEMAQVMEIVVPAGGQAELKPGGYHVMLFDMEQGLTVGDKVNFTLNFEKAGAVTITAEVKDN